MMSGMEALAFILENKVTKLQYQRMRNNAIRRHANIYPAYNEVRAWKKLILPPNIKISAKDCSVSIQDTLDHQLESLLKDENLLDRCRRFCEMDNIRLSLIAKYGCDGFSANAFYKGLGFSQKSVCASTLVLVSIKAINTVTNKSCIVWVNSRVNSPYAVCPLRYCFEKENKVFSVAEGKRLERQVQNLKPFYRIGLCIDYQLYPTQVDGKSTLFCSHL